MAAVEFEDVLIVGLGLIGGSLALALRRAGFRGRIAAVGREATIAEGRRRGAIDDGFGYDELPRAAESADLIVLATPIRTIIEEIAVLGGAKLRPGAIVTDAGSTKREVLAAAARSLPEGVRFIGGHPMAGSEARGIGAADPFLFQNAYYVLTPAAGTPAQDVERLSDLVSRTGAHVVVLSAEDHDRIAAAISHLPQLLAVALVNSLEDLGPLRDTAVRLAAGGFRNMTRIASSPFGVWRDIIATNRAPIAAGMDGFLRRLAGVSAQVSGGEAGERALEAAFGAAASTRAAIPKDTKGFLRPSWDVLVVVEDRPGVIAGIAGTLSARGINIKDIAVLKVREDEGGSLRLAFATRELAGEAVRILEAGGYEARVSD